MKKISTAQETKIIAMIARGDSYPTIISNMADEGLSVTSSTLSRIRERNGEALTFMKNAILKQQASISGRLLNRSRELLEEGLNSNDRYWEIIKELNEKLEAGEITEEEHRVMTPTAPSLSIRDLVSVSKEMFNQSQIESGKPTAITDNPTQAKENLKVLLEAINKGSDEDIARAIFLDA